LTLGGTLMAVDVKGGSTFRSGTPRPLFQTGIPPWKGAPEIPTSSYAVSKDGRFLINGTVEGATAPPVTIATHWLASLR